jgi:hypothetical protein
MSVQSQIDRLNAVKERIRTNLIAQGVTVPDNTMLEEMAAQILSVSGEDGVSATHSWNGTTLTITSASGTSSADLKGAAGKTPVKGSDYFTAADKAEMVEDVLEAMDSVPTVVCQSTAPADTSVIWVDTDDNSVDEFQEAVNTALAQAKASGEFTPVKGTDYWTPADQEAIVQQVIAALGTPVFGRVDADNNIILTGELVDGTYTIKYEDAEGDLTVIGTLNHVYVPEPSYTNVLATAINSDGSTFVGTNGEKGYKLGHRLNSSGAETSAEENVFVTGFIPVAADDVVYLDGLQWPVESGAAACRAYLWLYDGGFGRLSDGLKREVDTNQEYIFTSGGAGKDENNNLLWFTISSNMFAGASFDASKVRYLRLSAYYIGEPPVITINEPIV